jgi:hypothetical protein
MSPSFRTLRDGSYGNTKSGGSLEFEVTTNPINQDAMDNIQELIASFIMSQVINKKGEFHCNNPGEQFPNLLSPRESLPEIKSLPKPVLSSV